MNTHKLKVRNLIPKKLLKYYPFNYRATKIIYGNNRNHVSNMKGLPIPSLKNNNSIKSHFYKKISRF